MTIFHQKTLQIAISIAKTKKLYNFFFISNILTVRSSILETNIEMYGRNFKNFKNFTKWIAR